MAAQGSPQELETFFHNANSHQGRTTPVFPRARSQSSQSPHDKDSHAWLTRFRRTAKNCVSASKVAEKFTWRTSIKVALGICLFALFTNITLLSMAFSKHRRAGDGIGILNTGRSSEIAHLTTAYHVLINALSTGLLTSSNFCMQLLCAPTRHDIDKAHASGQWLEVGVLSFHNLHYISRRRSALWLVLAFTSVPLHLFYNSAVFSVRTGQDYSIRFLNKTDAAGLERIFSSTTRLPLKSWQSLYNSQDVPDAGDLWITVDGLSFTASIDFSNHTWTLGLPVLPADGTQSVVPWDEISWPPETHQVMMPIILKWDNNQSGQGSLELKDQTLPGKRFVVPLENYTTSMPIFDWPKPVSIIASDQSTWMKHFVMYNESWMNGNVTRLGDGYSTPLTNGSSIQLAIPFMLIVVICNALKVIAMFFTLRWSTLPHLVTQGDAISSFLEHSDASTLSYGTLDRATIVGVSDLPVSKRLRPWKVESRTYFAMLSVWTTTALLFSFLAGILVLLILDNKDGPGSFSDWAWGSASRKNLPIARQSFDAKGILFNTLLANFPQVLLSLAYFALNRLCTSMCFIREWNDHGLERKALRVASPIAQQRRAHFLQLPYRWSIPLTGMSGVLHWLLSQSTFLVRLDMRDADGNIKEDESRSTCGYSSLSLLVFALSFLGILAVVYGMQIRSLQIYVPPAEHCSLVISAACHPPPGDINPQFKPVRWGVVRNELGRATKHCSFTSENISKPKEGVMYL